MSKIKLKIISKIVPTEIRGVFSSPPLLMTESEEQYEQLFASLVEVIKPVDIIEWLFLKDVVDYSWETLRLRRLKAPLIDIERKRALSAVLRRIADHVGSKSVIDPERVSSEWFKDPKVKAAVMAVLEQHGLDEQSVTAQALMSCARAIETVDTMAGFAAARRDGSLREITCRRETLARVPKPLDIVDAEAEEVPRLPPATTSKRRQPAAKRDVFEDGRGWRKEYRELARLLMPEGVADRNDPIFLRLVGAGRGKQ